MLVLIMKQLSMPTYTEISQALSETTLKLHPSQAHGLMCGILCGSPDSQAAWAETVTGDEKSILTHEVLLALHDMTINQLNEFLFEFELVLPPDTETLPERAEALTLWCQGFLTGLKVAKVKLVGREDSEATEAINDLVEIAKISYEDVISNEEDEAAYTELVEYVRMAVILIYEDLHDTASPKKVTGSSSNHLH